MVLRYLSERTGLIGRLVLGGLGVAWSLATFLVAPVLVVEKVGPVQAISRSASLLRTTWGEQVAGNVGIGLVFGLASVVVGVAAALLFVTLVEASLVLGVLVAVVAIAVIAGLALLGSTLQAVFTASVYRYAVTGDGGTMFPRETLGAEGTFGPSAS
jgi:cobalamin biosynthesis protein CobD/CbiB